MMAKPDFETTWYPRIGEQAAKELRRGRKISLLGILSPLFAVGAGLLIGTSTLNDVIGVALATIGVSYIVMFFNAQRRLAAAMSDWFGVKIKGWQLPRMIPERFDAWCQARGLHHPGEQVASGQEAQSSEVAPGGLH
jgi:hypothetical protein